MRNEWWTLGQVERGGKEEVDGIYDSSQTVLCPCSRAELVDLGMARMLTVPIMTFVDEMDWPRDRRVSAFITLPFFSHPSSCTPPYPLLLKPSIAVEATGSSTPVMLISIGGLSLGLSSDHRLLCPGLCTPPSALLPGIAQIIKGTPSSVHHRGCFSMHLMASLFTAEIG